MLGASISSALLPVATRHVLPALDRAVPAELRKWNATCLDLALKALVILAAWALAPLVLAAHSALRGGQLAARHGLALLSSRGTIKGPVDDKLIHTVALGLAAAGVLSQAAAGFKVPFPFSVALLPATAAEWALRAAVGFSSVV